MRCVMCGKEVPKARAEFLIREGREVICIGCQEEMERRGEYKTYRGVIVTDGQGKYYDFAKTTADVPCDPFTAYRIRRPAEAEVE